MNESTSRSRTARSNSDWATKLQAEQISGSPCEPHPSVVKTRLNPTSLSQYIRLENCERYLRFRLVPSDVERLEKRWGITAQPLTPLLKESGADFEQNIANQLAAKGEAIVDLDKKDINETLKWLREVKEPTILLQPTLAAPIGKFTCSGRADVIHLSRNRQNQLKVLIADIKASRKEKTEHRLQVAIYARMIQSLAKEHNLPVEEIRGAVLTKQDDGSYPSLGPDTPTFELETYYSILDRLVVHEDAVVNQVINQPFERAFYHLSPKCDGCLYNALCMYDSAERLDLALTPNITAVEKRVLNEAGIMTISELANLMELPAQGQTDLRPVASNQETLDVLRNRWPVAPNLPFLVQRAKAAMRHFDPTADYRSYLIGSGFGTLPRDEDYPDLVKIFFDAQRDYLQDRVYMISALIIGPLGERTIVSRADCPPNDEIEKELLVEWIRKVIEALSEVALGNQATVHLYCYNRYDQKVLLDALKSHLSEVASIPAFFDLLTQHPALTQPIISFLADEVKERLNSGRVCAPLHDVARWRGFDWKDDRYDYFSLFRSRMFDNRRPVSRAENGRLVPSRSSEQEGGTEKIAIETASRFNSQIPLEYAYASWGRLPEGKEDSRLLAPFRQVDLAILTSFAAMRVRALRKIEQSFKIKARFLDKEPISLPTLADTTDEVGLVQSLREFLYMEHHTALQANLLNYALPIDRRVQSGQAMLLKFVQGSGNNLYAFKPEFGLIGVDPVLTMNGCRLKEGDWVVCNLSDPNISANQIKHGRLATIEAISKDEVVLQLLSINFPNGDFRYFHKSNLEPTVGSLYTIDPMSDDLNTDKILDALANIDSNAFFRWLEEKPADRAFSHETYNFYKKFVDLIDSFLKNRNRKLTLRQREVISGCANKPLILVQGPPGTGKSYTLAWAILARIAAAAIQGKPCRVLISCKTHNAINVELKALAESLQQIAGFSSNQFGGQALRSLAIYKLVNDLGDTVPLGVQPLNAYQEKQGLETIIQNQYVVFGATSGGAYNLMKYRTLGGRSIDWVTKTFDLVVIDEASQMSIPEGVLAGSFLKAQGNMIVVGDHRQMPPIIAHPWKDELKRSASENKPYVSFFEALIDRGFDQVKLDESFRLHEQIAEFLRANVYEKDGINFHSRRRDVIPQLPRLQPFIDAVLNPQFPIVVVEHTEQMSQQFNLVELELTRPLIDACVRYLSLDGKNGIGIVVPHRAQKALLRAEFPDLAEVNSIDTVERFQGDERDVIIVTATASDPDYVRNECDFLLNLNRLNVAISRPRKKLIVLASRTVVDFLTSDLEVFEQSAIWKRLFHHYTPDILDQRSINGYQVIVRGRKV